MSTVRTPDITLSIFGDNGIHSFSDVKESKVPLNQNMDAEIKHDWIVPSIPDDYPYKSAIGELSNECTVQSKNASTCKCSRIAVFLQFCETPLRTLFHFSYRNYERNGAYSEEAPRYADSCCAIMLCVPTIICWLVECPVICLGGLFEIGYCEKPKIVTVAEKYIQDNNLDGLIKLFDSSSLIDRDFLALELHHPIVELVLSYENTDVSLHRKKQMLMYIHERGFSILSICEFDDKNEYVKTIIKSKSKDSFALLDFILAVGGRVNKDKVCEHFLKSFQDGSLTFEAATEKAYVLAKYKIHNEKIDEIFSDYIIEPVVHEYFNTGKPFGVHKFGLYATSRSTQPCSYVSADVANIMCDYLRESKRNH